MRPMQSTSNKIRRVLWEFTWTLLCRYTPNPMHRWRCLILRVFGAKLGKNNFIYPRARIWAPWLLETADIATIASDAQIYNVGKVVLGHHAIISEGAFICGATHDYQIADFPVVSKAISIGPHVWICARAVILPGVSCGKGSVLGAGSVASRNLEPWTVYAGNPAQEVRKRNPIVSSELEPDNDEL